MIRRLTNFLTLCSLLLCAAAAALWLRGEYRSDWLTHTRIVERNGFTDVREWAISTSAGVVQVGRQDNRLRQGPGPNRLNYGGFDWETHAVAVPVFRSKASPTLANRLGFAWVAAQSAGADGGTQQRWRVGFPHWAAVLAFAAAPLVWLRRRLRRPAPPGHCRGCGYDLTGNVSGACPECGKAATGMPEMPGTQHRRHAELRGRRMIFGRFDSKPPGRLY